MPENPQFLTTRWSLVAAAGAAPASNAALAELCESYWYPLYAYVRRRGYTPDDARDLIQSFFLRLLENDDLQAADQRRGKFRSFLLGALNHFLANEWRRESAQKRGGGRPVLSLNFEAGESRYTRECIEPADEITPESLFERRWAMALMDRALSALRQEFSQAGKLPLHDALTGVLGGETDLSYEQIAAKLDMTEGAVKIAAHRLRSRCRELLREEIAQTLADGENVDDELKALFKAVEK